MNTPLDPLTTAPEPDRLATLQAGLDLIDQGLTVFDAELRMVAWNRAFLRLLDFPDRLAFVGASFESFIRYNADRGEYGEGDHDAQVARRVASARSFTPHEIERVRPDGRVILVRGRPLPGHGFITLYSDVTDQKRAEQQLRDRHAELEERVAERTQELARRESQLRLIIDSVPALIAYVDIDRHYRYINRGYERWFGLDPAHPERVSARGYLGDATWESIRPHAARAMAGETTTVEYPIRLVSGQMVMARTTLIPEHAPDGRVVGCFELTFDITEQKRSQELLAHAQKMEALGHLTGGLAHDFNNLLTVILGNLSALADRGPAEPLVDDFVQPAMEAARRGAELIRGLMTYSRQQPMAVQRVDVGEQVRSIARLVRRSLPESLALDVAVDDAAPLPARTDPTLLQNALLNLILNARDATAGRVSGATVRVSVQRVQRAVSVRGPLGLSDGPQVLLEVADNGSGMDAETQARVFEPFFTTKRPGLGTGLGLSMVQDFVRQSGGAVDIASRLGQGTTVSLWLPLDESADVPGTDVPGPRPAMAAGSRGLALLVEDEAAVRLVVRRQLLDLGWTVIEAEDGQEAMTMLDQMGGIGLLLTDVVMPGGLDGRTLARHAQAGRRVGRVLLMSGYAPGEVDTGGIPIIAKPFSRDELAAALAAPPEATS